MSRVITISVYNKDMRRKLLLIGAILVSLLLAYNSARRILTFKTTSEKVKEAEVRLEEIKLENEKLKQDLAYKESSQFAEAEIRNKLGLVKEGEAVVVVPRDEVADDVQLTTDKPNWVKWKERFFGS